MYLKNEQLWYVMTVYIVAHRRSQQKWPKNLDTFPKTESKYDYYCSLMIACLSYSIVSTQQVFYEDFFLPF